MLAQAMPTPPQRELNCDADVRDSMNAAAPPIHDDNLNNSYVFSLYENDNNTNDNNRNANDLDDDEYVMSVLSECCIEKFDSGASRCMSGNPDRLSTFQPFKRVRIVGFNNIV